MLARIERDLTSSVVETTWFTMIVVASQSSEVILALHIVDHILWLKTAERCVSGGGPCCRKCSTQRQMAATAHVRGWPVLLFPIDSPLTPFFCVVNSRLTGVAAAQVSG